MGKIASLTDRDRPILPNKTANIIKQTGISFC